MNKSAQQHNAALMAIAFSYFGVKEVAGDQHNPVILDFFKKAGHGYINDDETPWCAAGLNAWAKEAGYIGSGKLNARSFLKVGDEITDPQFGDVCVLHRGDPNGWQGHVGLFVRQDDNYVYLMGANQGDQVCVARFDKKRVLGFRRLHKAG